MSVKFFEKIDKLPIVKILQVSAAALFIVGIMGALMAIPFQLSKVSNASETFIILSLFIKATVQSAYSPLILLALAEIIKRKSS